MASRNTLIEYLQEEVNVQMALGNLTPPYTLFELANRLRSRYQQHYKNTGLAERFTEVIEEIYYLTDLQNKGIISMAQQVEFKDTVVNLRIVDETLHIGEYFKEDNGGRAIPPELADKLDNGKITSDALTEFSKDDVVTATIKWINGLPGRAGISGEVTRYVKRDLANAKIAVDKSYDFNNHFGEPIKVFVPKHVAIIVGSAVNMARKGLARRAYTLFKGHSGNGKTTLGELIAHQLGYELVTTDIGTCQTPMDVIGFNEIVNNETQFKLNWQIERIQKGKAVWLIDEINRADSRFLGVLNPLLDDRGYLDYRGHQIKIPKDVLIIANCNKGWKYTGTTTMDASLESRFPFQCEIGYLPVDQEVELFTGFGVVVEQAKKIVNVLTHMRSSHADNYSDTRKNNDTPLNIEISTRKSVALANTITANQISPRTAMQMIYGAQIDDANREELRVLNDIMNKLGEFDYELPPEYDVA